MKIRNAQLARTFRKDIHFKVPVITRNGTTFADNENAKELETAYFPVEVLSELKEKGSAGNGKHRRSNKGYVK